MSKRKSIVSSFGDLTSLTADEAKQPAAAEKPKTEQAARVPAGVIGATQRSLTDIREERDRLLAQAESGQQLLTLNPDDVDPSPFRDRLPDDNDQDYMLFRQSLKDEGQKTPISVRRHPEHEHRYQVVFGHRRWKALKELGLSVEAKLGQFTDRDLVVAQGIENAARQDLSWIEKALFCAEMEAAGIKAKDIKASLGVDDSELSKFRQVLRSIPVNVIERIGRAPKVGRPRWLELAGLVSGTKDLVTMEKTLAAAKVMEASSDERFIAVVTELSVPTENVTTKTSAVIRNMEGVGKVSFGKKDVRFVIDGKHADQFRAFMETEIVDLRERFLKTIDQE